MRREISLPQINPLLGLLLALVSLLCSCASTQLVGESTKIESALPPPSVILSPGDVIAIKYRYMPELNEEQTIRPDGKITLPMIGPVQAAGVSPEQLNDQLKEKYQAILKEPDIIVIVRSLANQQIYVGGEVRTPGIILLKGPMTVLDAVIAAGGFNKTSAELETIIIIRQVENKNHAMSINLKDTLTHTQSDRFYLAPFDVVYVPQNKIDQVDQWVDQNINRLIPQVVSTGVFGLLLNSSR